jgi:hypothetical protein
LGGPNAGSYDAWIAKYDAGGNQQWVRQFGTPEGDLSRGGLSADGLGNVYFSGWTNGSLATLNAGGSDAFIAKFNAAGNQLWTRQLGSAEPDLGQSVSTDGRGNIYLSGHTSGSLGGSNAGGSDAWVAKYDANGNHIWTHQLGTESGDFNISVSDDGLGNIYISGNTAGSLGGPNAGGSDAFLAKLVDSAANLSGDFNNDGAVDAADYVTWRNGLGNGYTQDHYAEWRASFGQSAAGAVAVDNTDSGNVPEPGALLLTGMSLFLCRLPGPFRGLFRRRSPRRLAAAQTWNKHRRD